MAELSGDCSEQQVLRSGQLLGARGAGVQPSTWQLIAIVLCKIKHGSFNPQNAIRKMSASAQS